MLTPQMTFLQTSYVHNQSTYEIWTPHSYKTLIVCMNSLVWNKSYWGRVCRVWMSVRFLVSHGMRLSLLLQTCVSGCDEPIYLHNTAARWRQLQGFLTSRCASAAEKRGHFFCFWRGQIITHWLTYLFYHHECVSDCAVRVPGCWMAGRWTC